MFNSGNNVAEIGWKKVKLLIPIKLGGRPWDVLELAALKENNIDAKLFLTDWGLTVKAKYKVMVNGSMIDEEREYFIPYNHVGSVER